VLSPISSESVSIKRRFLLHLRTVQVTTMTTAIKITNPANPKTNPERGLLFRKAFPFICGAPLEGEAVVGAVDTAVNRPFGVGANVSRLFGFQLTLAGIPVGFSVPGRESGHGP